MGMRPYQMEAISQIRSHYATGTKKVLLVMATGAGKTHIFSDILKKTADRGKRCMMVVRGRQLVEQASRRLFHEFVPHGVRMGNHWNKNYAAPIQICSIDTMLARADHPDVDLIVVDEAHLFTSPKCVEYLQSYEGRAYILAVTASPWTRKSLRHLGDVVVHPVTMQDLIELGFLLPPRYYAPSTPDLRGVRTIGEDYDAEQLEQRMGLLTGDIPGHWHRIAEQRPTFCFAVNIRHSLSLVDRFRASGIPAEHVEGDTPLADREAAIQRLVRGEIKVLSNVGILCTGVDVPPLGCILGARPTQSYNLYVQILGRGTRLHPETQKKDFIFLDHAGNVLRHGFVKDEPEIFLDGVPKKKREVQGRVCPECFAIFVGMECHACGLEIPIAERKTVEIEDEILAEIKHLPEAVEISIFIRRCKDTAARKGYKKGWVFYQVKEKYGEDVAQQAFPRRRSGGAPWFMKGSM